MSVETNATSVKSANNRKGRILPDLGNTIPASATKPVVARTNSNMTYDTALTVALMSTFQPLLEALDDIPQLLMEDIDSGQAHPSTTDNDLKYLLSGFLSILNRKQRGDTIIQKKDASGRVISKNRIYNNKERMDYSQQKVDEMTEVLGKEDFQTCYYKEVNHARYFAYEDLFYALAQTYRKVFNENWKPVDQAAPTTTTPVKVDAAEKNKWLAKAKSRAA